MRMNFKNILMGLGAWLVLGYALHDSTADKGTLGFVGEAKDVDAAQKAFKATIDGDDKKT